MKNQLTSFFLISSLVFTSPLKADYSDYPTESLPFLAEDEKQERWEENSEAAQDEEHIEWKDDSSDDQTYANENSNSMTDDDIQNEGTPVGQAASEGTNTVKKKRLQNIALAAGAIAVAVTALILIAHNDGHDSHKD